MKWHRHTTSIVLAAIAIALGVWIWMDRASVTEGERVMRPKNVFSAWRREQLSRIELDAAENKLVLVRDVDRDADAAWRIERPEPGLADPNAVDQLTSAFEFATFVRRVDPKATPAFDAPRASGTVSMGKLVYRFALGATAPTPEGAAYFQVDGEGVFVVAKDFVDRLLTAPASYKSRTIVPYLSLDLASLEVRGKGVDLRLERSGELSFKLGSGLRASREQLDRLWSAFAEMRADSFTDADVKEPVLTIVMTPKDGRPRGELLIGGACPDHSDDVVVVRTAPSRVAACAPRGIIEGLSQSPADLVDTRLFFAREDELEELTISNDDAKIDLARKGSGWHVRAPFDRDLIGDEVDAANALASAVIRAKGANVAPFVTAETFSPRAHIRAHGGEMAGDELIDLGEGPHGWVVRRLADGARLDVSLEIARRLQPSKSALKSRDVIVPALDPKDVDLLSLHCGVSQDLKREAMTWTLVAPAGFVADQAKALDLVDQIAHLRADTWVADVDDGSFGFATSSCTVTLTAQHDGGTRAIRLKIGREAESGLYVVVEDGSATSPVFLEPRVFRDAMARILVDRSALAVDSTRASSIVLTHGGTRVEIRRIADRLVGPDAGLAVTTASIASALDTLRADDVVRLGPPGADEGFASPSLEIHVELEGDAGKRSVWLRFGRDVLRKNQTMVLARVAGVDATFAVARERVDPIRNAL